MTADSLEPPLTEVLDGLRWIAVSTQLGDYPDGAAPKRIPPPVRASA